MTTLCLGAATLSSWACGGTAGPPLEQNDTDTDGIATGFVDDGADSTGGGGEEFAGCVYANTNDISGLFSHQCAAEYDVDFTFEFLRFDGVLTTPNLGLTGIQTTAPPSSYEHPFAAACCSNIEELGGFNPGDDTCATPHHRACYSDLVQHLCEIPSGVLFQAAQDNTFNGGSVLQQAGQWFHDHINDCYNHFWTGTDALNGADYCGTEFDSFYEHPPWTPDVTFTLEAPGGGDAAWAGNFSLAPETIFNHTGVLPLPTPASECNGPVGNEGELPPLSEPGAGSVAGQLATGVSGRVMGPTWGGELIAGSGTFGNGSSVQYSTDAASLRLEQMVMFEAGPTTAGTSTVEADVSAFRLQLLGAQVAPFSGRYYRLTPGQASFTLSATADGLSDFVHATNASNLDLYLVSGGVGACPTSAPQCLVSRSYTIEYTDGSGESWELDVGAATWAP